MERDALFDDGEALFELLHLGHVFGEVFGIIALERNANAAVVDADLVPNFASEELVHRHSSGLAGNVPQRNLDRADRRAPRLETAQPADAAYDTLDVGRVLTKDGITVVENEGFEIGLRPLGLAETFDAFVGSDADDRVIADDGAFEVGDFHWVVSSGGLLTFLKE